MEESRGGSIRSSNQISAGSIDDLAGKDRRNDGNLWDFAETLINSAWASMTYAPLIRPGSVRHYVTALGNRLKKVNGKSIDVNNHKAAKIPSPADMRAYPNVIGNQGERERLFFLERDLSRVFQLTGDRYIMLTRNEIFLRVNSVAVLDYNKGTAVIRYERLINPGRVFFEMALINAGFKLAPYSEAPAKNH